MTWPLRFALRCLLGFFLSDLATSNYAQAPQSEAPSLILHGTVTGKQNNTYIEAPFTVPEGTVRVTLQFSYTGKEQRTPLDLGLTARMDCAAGVAATSPS